MEDNEICWSNLSGVNRRARCHTEALQKGSALELHVRIEIYVLVVYLTCYTQRHLGVQAYLR